MTTDMILFLPDGIYFNLPEQAYHDDPALGSTDLKALLVNPVQWHFKSRNPLVAELFGEDDQAKKESAAKRFGKALHTIVLEPDEFDTRYCVEEERPELPSTKGEIAAAIVAAGHGPPKDSEKRDGFISAARLLQIETLDDWKQIEAMRTAGREVISRRWWHSLQMTRRAINAHSEAAKFLSSGRAEVSVFWTDDDGTRLKVRFDYLRVRTTADVKSYALRDGIDPVECFVAAMANFAYDFSAAHYMHARKEVFPRLVAEGRIYDGRLAATIDEPLTAVPEDVAFAQKVADYTSPTWWWIACMTQGAPEVDAVQLPDSIIGFVAANSQVEIAKQRYREFRDKFGDDDSEMWVADRGLIRLTDHNFGVRAMGRGEARWEQFDGKS